MPPDLGRVFSTHFEWCEIPAGNITLQGKSHNVSRFWMAKYPITHPQFAMFIEAGGYSQPQWWTETGWTARTEGWNFNSNRDPSGITWDAPRDWDYIKSQEDTFPASGISWYEAMAFCMWLNAQIDDSAKVTLPTQYQWLWVMQNNDKPDGNRYGVMSPMDILWEWCLDEYQDEYTQHHMGPGAEWYILGTNSFGPHLTSYARAGQRINLNPHNWFDYHYGIRLVFEEASSVCSIDI